MGRLVQKIEAAFASKASATIHVPEWDLTLTVFPLTLGQLSVIDAEPNEYRRAARSIQVRAKNQDGSPMFDEDDFEKLVSHGVGPFGPKVVGRVALELQRALDGSIPEDTDAAKKG